MNSNSVARNISVPNFVYAEEVDNKLILFRHKKGDDIEKILIIYGEGKRAGFCMPVFSSIKTVGDPSARTSIVFMCSDKYYLSSPFIEHINTFNGNNFALKKIKTAAEKVANREPMPDTQRFWGPNFYYIVFREDLEDVFIRQKNDDFCCKFANFTGMKQVIEDSSGNLLLTDCEIITPVIGAKVKLSKILKIIFTNGAGLEKYSHVFVLCGRGDDWS